MRIPEVERAGVVTFEIDTPEQMDRKASILKDAGVVVPASTRADAHVRRAGFTSFEGSGLDEVWKRYLSGEPHPAAWTSKVGVAVG